MRVFYFHSLFIFMQNDLRIKIRNLIMELTYQTDDCSVSLLNDIDYLKDFSLNNKHSDEQNDFWIFYFYTHNKDYKIICSVTREKSNDVWSLKSQTFWKDFNKKKTPGSGMEYSVDIKGVKGYKEFVDTVNRKLKNNPMVNSDLYHDDYGFAMTKEVVREIIRLMIEYPKIKSLTNSAYYDELKKLYNDTLDLSVEETIKYIDDNYPGADRKQMLIYKLNSMDSLHNFNVIQQMSITPKDEEFK